MPPALQDGTILLRAGNVMMRAEDSPVDVWVIDLGRECDLWWFEGVLAWEPVQF